MTLIEFNNVMDLLGLTYSIGVIFYLDQASDLHRQWQPLVGKNDEAAGKLRTEELGYQRMALATALDESVPGAMTFESTVPKMTRDQLMTINDLIKGWNHYLARFNKNVPEIM
ncbi:hypothetical protein [Furfurilactobacillus entadae]|uniref:hypothetical protein n=1 Tax=Furfurilactobacillus entadae TaxID=2922307 RepID=UPI0035EAA056